MKFEIYYEITGTRKMEVTVPDSISLPKDWEEMTLPERDEWIYKNQSSSQVIFEDLDGAKAVGLKWLD